MLSVELSSKTVIKNFMSNQIGFVLCLYLKNILDNGKTQKIYHKTIMEKIVISVEITENEPSINALELKVAT